MGDPAHGAAQQEEGERRVLGQAEHALDHDGGEVDVGLAVDQPFAGDGQALGESKLGESGTASRSSANKVAARISPSG